MIQHLKLDVSQGGMVSGLSLVSNQGMFKDALLRAQVNVNGEAFNEHSFIRIFLSRQGVDPNCYQERRPTVETMGECQDKVRIEFSIIV